MGDLFRMVLMAGTMEPSTVTWNKIKQMVNNAEESGNKMRKSESCKVTSVDPSAIGSCTVASVGTQFGEQDDVQKRVNNSRVDPWSSTATTEADRAP